MLFETVGSHYSGGRVSGLEKGDDHRNRTIKFLKPVISGVTYVGDKPQLLISNCTHTLALAIV